MSAPGGCGPVRGTHRLRLNRVETGSTYIAPVARRVSIAQAVTMGPLDGAPTVEVQRLVSHSTIGVIPDWSGSTFAVYGGDPHDAIGAAGESLFGLQRRAGGGTGLVVPWGDTPPPELAAGPLDVQKNFRLLKRSLRGRVNLGGNDLPAALRRTAERLPALRADQTLTVFIPTDGCEAVTQETHDAVAALPSRACHLILLDPLHWCTPEMEADWRSVAFGSIVRIEDFSVHGIAAEMGRVYASSLGLSLRGTPSPASKSLLNRKKHTS